MTVSAPGDRPETSSRPVDPDRPEDAAIVPAVPVRPEPVEFSTVFRWSVAVGLGLLVVAGLALTVYAVRQILVQVLIAMFIAVSLDPAVRWLIKRGVRRSVAVGIIFTLTLAAVTAFLVSITPPLAGQAAKLADDVPGYFNELKDRSATWRDLADEYGLTQRLTEWAASLPGKIGADAFAFVQRFLGAVLNVLLVIVLTIYFMVDLPRLRRGLVRLFPYERRPKVAQAVNVMVDKVGSYMIGNLLISLVAGLTSFLVLWALDVPFALPLAVFVAITDLIPLVGATIGAAGCMVVALFTVDLWPNATLLALFFLAYQQLENYLIAPRILKNTVDLSSIAVLLAALIGGTILGVVGALMAIPIAAAIKVLASPVVDALNEQPERPVSPPPIMPAP